jgi:hypothetical protein
MHIGGDHIDWTPMYSAQWHPGLTQFPNERSFPLSVHQSHLILQANLNFFGDAGSCPSRGFETLIHDTLCLIVSVLRCVTGYQQQQPWSISKLSDRNALITSLYVGYISRCYTTDSLPTNLTMTSSSTLPVDADLGGTFGALFISVMLAAVSVNHLLFMWLTFAALKCLTEQSLWSKQCSSSHLLSDT